MKPLNEFPKSVCRNIRFVLTDIDDTVTSEGRLTGESYLALDRLQKAGFHVIPITGRPAGWCDHIARMWPVDAVVGENGAFYFRYDHGNRKMICRFWKDETERKLDRMKIEQLRQSIPLAVPGSGIASDQDYRIADLAVDFCEDVEALPQEQIDRIVDLFNEAGAKAKISSIHVNGWFGDYDKLTMTEVLFREVYNLELEDVLDQVVFAGDSPNDAPMFARFPHSVGVANVADFVGRIPNEPTWITDSRSGQGFVELANLLIG
ncbi:HAD-IIB family hydrolase [Kiloniella laminariae]|uniref:HAD-IIB family hydrolase n=1 Tax=Kiloniella laminariae TaxID=454162 RepID=A0ABT4LJ46_9PROT|nr:HAD-IIB family hydrolase [Kiloniella laminariae]MCZ4281102.1 HAD-IIB family hydrolase [Kiloniella laminariae]